MRGGQGMLRYLDNGEDVKVGIPELQERQGTFEKVGISVQQVAQQAMIENGQKIFRHFEARRRRVMYCQWGQVGRKAERSGGIAGNTSFE